MNKRKVSPDALWKSAIEDLVEDFLHFFYEKYVELIDWSHPVEFLDKELDRLFPNSGIKQRRGDKLLKVRFKDNQLCYFLIHVEVQGYDDKDFPKRMFQCYYRLKEKHNLPVTALVIYTNSSSKHHYLQFQEAFLDTELIYRFPTFVLKDVNPSELSKSNNPFAIVLETAWYSLNKIKLLDEDLFQLKLRLARNLFQKGFKKKKIEHLLNFITYYMPFERGENFLKFENAISKKHQTMGIRETIINHFKEVAREEGLAEGIEEGRMKGKEDVLQIIIMNKQGVPPTEIAKSLSIPEEEVLEILNKINS